MSALFFTAGYFAVPSIEKRGGGKFILDKLKTLGAPWLVVTAGIMPALDYIVFAAQNESPCGYGKYWLLSMRKIAEFRFGWLDMDRFIP